MLGTAALIGTSIAGAALGAAGSMGASAIQGAYNKEEAQRNRDFQERMSNTAIQRRFADARKAGISPAMLLGEASQPMGSTASIGQPDIGGQMASTVNKIIDAMREDRKLDAIEQMHDEKLDHQTQMQQMKMANSANRFIHHDYDSKKYEFQNIDDIKI